MLKRISILSSASLTILVAVCVVWPWNHYRTHVLTKVDLARNFRSLAGPQRLKEGRPELRSTIELAASRPSNPAKLAKSAMPLSEDEVSIYRIVLAKVSQLKGALLNVSTTTEPLTPRDLDHCDCLRDFNLENLLAAFHSYHQLTKAVLTTKQMRLVDSEAQSSEVRANDPSTTIREGKTVDEAVDAAFAAGLLSMSEIAFDRDRRYAVVSYGFWCGLLCGNGATLVFERVNGQWRLSDRNCGSWIS